jgi:predicted HicB family RNase H-like nuclease
MAKKGIIRNPSGRNQWEGSRADKPITVRLQKELDEQVRERAATEGKSLTEVVEEAIAAYLTRTQPTTATESQ